MSASDFYHSTKHYAYAVVRLVSMFAIIVILLYGLLLLVLAPIAVLFNDAGSGAAPVFGLLMLVIGVVYVKQAIRAVRAFSQPYSFAKRTFAQCMMIIPAITICIIVQYGLQVAWDLMWYLMLLSGAASAYHGYLLEDVSDGA